MPCRKLHLFQFGLRLWSGPKHWTKGRTGGIASTFSINRPAGHSPSSHRAAKPERSGPKALCFQGEARLHLDEVSTGSGSDRVCKCAILPLILNHTDPPATARWYRPGPTETSAT